jgi:hypothetical protein
MAGLEKDLRLLTREVDFDVYNPNHMTKAAIDKRSQSYV